MRHLYSTILLFIAFFLSSCAEVPQDVSEGPIAIIGDFGITGTAESEVAQLVKSWNPTLIATTGDNNYPTGAASAMEENVGQYYGSYLAKGTFFPSLGNHDWDTNPAPYYAYFNPPGNQRYYDFLKGQVHFFMMNSCLTEPDGRSASSVQAEWLRSKLSSSTALYKLVIFHHPPYTSPSTHSSDEQMRWHFQEWGATAVLTGHNHFYERLEVNGFPYFVNGSGGADLYGISNPDAQSKARVTDRHGAQRISVGNGILFEFVDTDGVIRDELRL